MTRSALAALVNETYDGETDASRFRWDTSTRTDINDVTEEDVV